MSSASPVSRRSLAELMLAPQRLRLQFQPVVDLARGEVAGYEALARFDVAPRRSPEAWFAASVAYAGAGRLDALAVSRALAARRALPAGCFLAVNVTPACLLTDAVQQAFARAGDLDAVVVELAEPEAAGAPAELAAALAPLRAAGARVAVDDAGEACAGLEHLVGLRPDFVKVDRAVVAGVDRDAEKARVVATLVALAARVDAQVVAEGAERAEELEAVMALGVRFAQGFALGAPAHGMRSLDRRVLEALPGRLAA
jgi:EAL domain-containing protein (putative c-di-GMP-specific phosphodiesterase class I)